MILAISACTGTQQPAVETTDVTSSPQETTPTPSPDEKLSVNAGFLRGPTGLGASYLMEQNDMGEAALDYTFTIESDPTIMTSAIISGDVDIAAMPTNVAAVLFNKTDGNVKIIAVNTLSVLYILENGDSIQSVSDLQGKTIYAMGQAANPEYVLNDILRQNGLQPGTDVTVEFMDPGELASKMATGSIDICMLPVPLTTSVLMKNTDVRVALNLGEEWTTITGGNDLTQGCVVVRSDIPNVDTIVAKFLEDYSASVSFMSSADNLDAAAQLAVKYGIVASEAVAKAAIPESNLTFIAGGYAIKNSISGYFEVLFKAEPKSLGGMIPDDTFYFGQK